MVFQSTPVDIFSVLEAAADVSSVVDAKNEHGSKGSERSPEGTDLTVIVRLVHLRREVLRAGTVE